jgi:hypothetical protein
VAAAGLACLPIRHPKERGGSRSRLSRCFYASPGGSWPASSHPNEPNSHSAQGGQNIRDAGFLHLFVREAGAPADGALIAFMPALNAPEKSSPVFPPWRRPTQLFRQLTRFSSTTTENDGWIITDSMEHARSDHTRESSYPCAVRLTRQGASSASRPEALAARGAPSQRLERDVDALFVAAVLTENGAVTSEALSNPAAAEDANVIPFVPRQRRDCPSPRSPSFPPKCRSDGSVVSVLSPQSSCQGRPVVFFPPASGYRNLVRQQGSIIRCAFQ